VKLVRKVLVESRDYKVDRVSRVYLVPEVKKDKEVKLVRKVAMV
jgi:hypothetical protein